MKRAESVSNPAETAASCALKVQAGLAHCYKKPKFDWDTYLFDKGCVRLNSKEKL